MAGDGLKTEEIRLRRLIESRLNWSDENVYDNQPTLSANWVNIDIPTKLFTLHEAPDCIYIEKMEETPYKGLKTIKRDGGWMQYENRDAALQAQLEHFKRHKIVFHCHKKQLISSHY